jgi:hypothetical protein
MGEMRQLVTSSGLLLLPILDPERDAERAILSIGPGGPLDISAFEP